MTFACCRAIERLQQGSIKKVQDGRAVHPEEAQQDDDWEEEPGRRTYIPPNVLKKEELDALEKQLRDFDPAIYGDDPDDEETQELMERLAAEKDCRKTGVGQTWSTFCRRDPDGKFEIPFEYMDTYRNWLLKLKTDDGRKRFKKEDLPTEKGQSIKPGLKLPPPHGREFREMIDDRGLKWKSKYAAYEARIIMEDVMEEIYRDLKSEQWLERDLESITREQVQVPAEKSKQVTHEVHQARKVAPIARVRGR